MREHVLVVLPHPDDESFGVAGTIALKRKEGIPVTYACLTLGEMGRNMGSPLFANREVLPLIRKRELEDACRAMDIEDLRMLGMRDKTLEFEDIELFADRIQELIEEIKPSLVVTFYPEHGVHPDHDATGRAVIHAIKRLPADERPLTYCMAITKNREEVLGEANVIIDIREVAGVKLEALKAHRSQTEGLIKEMEKKYQEQDAGIMSWLFEQEIFWTYKWD
ncbi:bacillithiol biosynthesis deacetylase BshB2 [Metabacillus sp. GX 13764]|uniref:bacillithiol biosynthesis deacetylase BshB2 n=1 Tax=Metabacillus kandeliae TaxID=2900151 RepID=UPI001E364F18|nr:bacillithiol biosynthesis deacetylase BshB2 [Metabacillus kandeliae]MCD7033514.1 bacillithiol biosynthesis deacetylase BshB2 [Metabacillus kandeliae]